MILDDRKTQVFDRGTPSFQATLSSEFKESLK